MTPMQRIMATILAKAGVDANSINADNVNDLYYLYKYGNEGDDSEDDDSEGDEISVNIHDLEEEFRGGEVETDLPTEFNRHYEVKAVAAQMFDGSWVGWTYYYGGGKWGAPEEEPWMEDAYNLELIGEEQIIITKKKFKVINKDSSE